MGADSEFKVRIGHEELVVRRRYEAMSIANDLLIALWFVAGSVLFFWDSTTEAATWMFLLGSIEFLLRPMIRLARRVHLHRLQGGHPHGGHRDDDDSFDF